LKSRVRAAVFGAALGEAQYRGPWEQVVSLLAEEWSPVAWMSLYSPPWTP